MPKKTKKQKLLAKLHRRIPAASYSLNNVKSQNIVQSGTTPSFTYKGLQSRKNSVINVQNTETATYYSYVRNDLIRITIFTAAAITLQVVLYFFLHRV